MLPEAAGRPAPGDDGRWGPISFEQATSVEEYDTLHFLQVWSHNWPVTQLSEWEQDQDSLTANVLTALVMNYADALRPDVRGPGIPLRTNWFGHRGSVLLTLRVSGDGRAPANFDELALFYSSLGSTYRGERYWFPKIAGASMHPLMAWWAMLYALSMLARYEPEQWVRLIQVDTSAWATPLEHLLDCAIDALPEVIYEALATPPTRTIS